jgi:hypothetical protein
MENRILVRLQILGELLPDEVTRRLGISPDVCWLRGDSVASTALHRKTNGWQLNSGVSEALLVKDQLVALFERLRGTEELVHKLSEQAEILVSCVVYSDSQPELFLDTKIIRSIAGIGAAIDFDVYIRE